MNHQLKFHVFNGHDPAWWIGTRHDLLIPGKTLAKRNNFDHSIRNIKSFQRVYKCTIIVLVKKIILQNPVHVCDPLILIGDVVIVVITMDPNTMDIIWYWSHGHNLFSCMAPTPACMMMGLNRGAHVIVSTQLCVCADFLIWNAIFLHIPDLNVTYPILPG